MTNIYNKIYLLRSLMKKYKIDYLDIKHDEPNMTKIEMEDDIWNHYKKIFRISKKKPTNMHEILLVIVGMIKHITCPEILIRNHKKCNKKDHYCFELSDKIIKHHLILHKFSDHYDSQTFLNQYKDDILIDEHIFD